MLCPTLNRRFGPLAVMAVALRACIVAQSASPSTIRKWEEARSREQPRFVTRAR
jgi:hypothetical protein